MKQMSQTSSSPAISKMWSAFFVRSKSLKTKTLYISGNFERTKKADHFLEMAALVLFCFIVSSIIFVYLTNYNDK